MPRLAVHPVVAYSARARAKLTPAELSRVADVEAELSVVRVGAEAGGVESMLGPLQRLLEADSAGAYAPSRDGEGSSLTFGRFTGSPRAAPRTWKRSCVGALCGGRRTTWTARTRAVEQGAGAAAVGHRGWRARACGTR